MRPARLGVDLLLSVVLVAWASVALADATDKPTWRCANAPGGGRLTRGRPYQTPVAGGPSRHRAVTRNRSHSPAFSRSARTSPPPPFSATT